MKRTMKFSALTLVLFLLWASPGFAVTADPWASYGDATHTNPTWQNLGPSVSDKTDGVFWSIYRNGSWSAWDQDTSLKVGDKVGFQFIMHKDHVGRHKADYLKAWLDWGQDGTFDEGDYADGGDVIVFGNHWVENRGDDSPTNKNYDFYSYYYNNTTFDITKDMAGKDLFLRARVTCSDDLASLANDNEWTMTEAEFYAAFAATGNIWQGDVEEYVLNVAPTPIPPSVFLLGTGLFGFMVATRKRFTA